jgi:NADPH:quinone reductase-like Zn-dependent oxidoreductase
MDWFGKRESEHATPSVHDENRKRLWIIHSDDSNESDEARDTSSSNHPFDRVVALGRPSSEESRDVPNVDDYDESLFEYESLTYFNLPRPLPHEVIIAVQAATISSLKMNVQKEVTIDNVALDLDSGIAIVGVVREVGDLVDKESIQVGNRVATVLKSVMKNARYAQVSSDMIVQVPPGLDSAEAAATAYTYLLAFQTLTHGIVDPVLRYSTNLFSGKNILIMDGASTSSQAMIQIAKSLGAQSVFATGPDSRHEILQNLGAIPLQEDPKEWIQRIEGRIHVVIDNVLAKCCDRAVQKVLVKKGGRIVYFGMPITMDSLKYGSSDSWKCLVQQFLAQISLMFSSSTDATYYDLFTNLECYPGKIKVRFASIVLYSSANNSQ